MAIEEAENVWNKNPKFSTFELLEKEDFDRGGLH